MSRVNMKKILLFTIFLAACAGSDEYPEYVPLDISKLSYTTKQSVPVSAFKYVGLEENKDRKSIKELVGVDPVQTEWCAAFVNAVLEENDIKTSAAFSDYPLMARSFLSWGEKVDDPKLGDIVVFERGEDGWTGHVGFFIEERGNQYLVFGGNQDDKITFKEYPKNKLLGIRRYNT
jgi:uncharacterized protein (TIGR02594 family)